MVYELGVNPAISPAQTWVKHFSKIVNPHSLGNNGTNRDPKSRRATMGDRTCKRKVCTESIRELYSDAKFVPNFAGGSQSSQKQEEEIDSGRKSGEFTDQARL